MEVLLVLIARFRWVLYALCGIGAAYFLLMALSGLRDLQRSVFRLERSAANARMTGSLIRAAVTLLIALGVMLLSGLAPQAAVDSAAAGTPAAFGTPLAQATARSSAIPTTSGAVTPRVSIVGAGTNTPAPSIAPISAATATRTAVVAATSAGTSAIRPTNTATLAPTLTPLPVLTQASAVPANNCASPAAQISAITATNKATRGYNVRGTAIVESGGYFKIETLLPSQLSWSPLTQDNRSVTDNSLVDFSFGSAAFPDGDYPLRLVIVKSDGSISAMCQTVLKLRSS
jgi:hypothetical protein